MVGRVVVRDVLAARRRRVDQVFVADGGGHGLGEAGGVLELSGSHLRPADAAPGDRRASGPTIGAGSEAFDGFKRAVPVRPIGYGLRKHRTSLCPARWQVEATFCLESR